MSGATSTFGLLSSFDHTTQSWETYKGRIAQWFIANDIDDTKDAGGQKRRAILLSALSDGTYKLAADLALPKELQTVPYEDIVKLLDGHFTPKRCGFGERYKFYAATQQSGETFPQWAARLRGLSAHCGFKNVEESLRDKFVMGMLSGPEKEKLFARDLTVLTLAKAVEANGKFKWCRGTIVKKVGKVVYIVKDNITSKTFKKHKNQIVLDKGHDCAYPSYWDEDIEFRDDDTSSPRPPTPSEELQPSTGEEGERTVVLDPHPASSELPEPISTPQGSIPGGQSEEDDEFLEALPGPFQNKKLNLDLTTPAAECTAPPAPALSARAQRATRRAARSVHELQPPRALEPEEGPPTGPKHVANSD
ncbi:uncharacterized protein LOC134794496 [Cydia splendana]|uniref:uncharacterized protein LOC134794496 n=1 Tax=Cydia splendana TaxID=1100963 RepID=UPI00300D652C